MNKLLSLFVVLVRKLLQRNSDNYFHVNFTSSKISREICLNFTWNSFHLKFTWKNSREFHSWCSFHVKNFRWNSHEIHVDFTCGDFACVMKKVCDFDKSYFNKLYFQKISEWDVVSNGSLKIVIYSLVSMWNFPLLKKYENCGLDSSRLYDPFAIFLHGVKLKWRLNFCMQTCNNGDNNCFLNFNFF